MQISREEFDSLNGKIRELTELNEKLAKEKASELSMKEHYSKKSSDLEKEIEQMHNLLDVMEGSGPREIEGSYGSMRQMAPMTRLAAWLAHKVKVQLA